jgi:EAL domain-containing protein (putative c-di-GMP-specific phosphodiesterase class I)
MSTRLVPTVTSSTTVAEILASGTVHSVYQPIVELVHGTVVAVEALGRGPLGDLHNPDPLFTAAAAEGLTAELDWACRAAALDGALTARLPEGIALFVNVESSHLGTEPPAVVQALEAKARAGLHVILELTERDLVRRPSDVLAAVYTARRNGWGVALDDVGAHPDSLALMPLVRPDVVKLDMALVQGRQTVEVGRIASAVGAYAEETGAAVLAEGIETELHLERAIALGATLGQGWRYGRPGALRPMTASPHSHIVPLRDFAHVAGTPFGLVGRHLRTRVARKSQLMAMSRHLEGQAVEQPIPPLLFAAFEDVAFFTADTERRYARYARTCPLVAAFGVGLPEEAAPGVRGADLDPSDPLTDEWTVIVLSPHFAGALIARDLGDPRGAEDRRFEFAVTHDRQRVTTAARCLVERIASHP